MATIPCADDAGSLNDPNGSPAQTGKNNPALTTYTPPSLEIGRWEISTLSPDACAQADQLRQETYIAESLNISGAPINIFKLLGVHQQDSSSLKNVATILASPSAPGSPTSGVNSGTGSWKSLQTGSGVTSGSVWIGMDFGIKTFTNSPNPIYSPSKPKLTPIGAVYLTQANTPQEFARRVRVETTDGSCEISGVPMLSGVGNGTIEDITLGSGATEGTLILTALSSPNAFSVMLSKAGGVLDLGTATVGQQFNSTVINFTITSGTTPFNTGDLFSIRVSFIWKRSGVFSLAQSPLPQVLNFQTPVLARAVRIIPTVFNGSGSWEVLALDANPAPKESVENIEDSFFNENRDRDYAVEPVLLKVQYTPTDSNTDLSRFGLSMMDQYTFKAAFSTMVRLLNRPIVVGDIIEVIPELQYDTQLRPVRKFLEVVDTGWDADGFSTSWRPTIYRFSAQQVLPSQETRDIFGTIDTQKYILSDDLIVSDIGAQIDTLPLTSSEEISKAAGDRVPEIGSDDSLSVLAVPKPSAVPIISQPVADITDDKPQQAALIEDGLPPGGLPYGEGFALPTLTDSVDGQYFRLYYAPETQIPPRLYRFSSLKNRWIYQETDRRGKYSSHRPSVRGILESSTKQAINSKTPIKSGGSIPDDN